MKKVIALGAAVALCVAGASFVSKQMAAKAAVEAMSQGITRTTPLQKSNLTESVTVTGTVKSSAVANVTSNANYKITDVFVAEGDSVIEGQILAMLDTTDLRDQISKAQKSLTDGIATAQRNYNDAVETRDETHEKALKGEVTLNDAQTALNNNANAFNGAKNLVRQQQDAYNAAFNADQEAGKNVNNTAYLTAQSNYQTAQANKIAADQNCTAAEAALAAAIDNPEITDYTPFEIAKQNAIQAKENAKQLETTAQATFLQEEAKQREAVLKKQETETALANAILALNTAKQNCNYTALEAAYNAAESAQKAARQSLDSLEATYKSALKNVISAEEALKKAKTSDTLETLQKQLKDCEIKATTSGTITAVNATVGSMAAGNATSGPLFAIQDTANLKVAVTIDEYDISNIREGQKVVILSDATGGKEISGTISQISLTATTTQSSTGFGAEITVNDKNSGLLIGMSAKAKIIISEKAGVFSVPYDAVGTDETGASVVYVKQADGSFSPLPVSVGMETDYYVEITGDGLSEGMEIRSSADESSLNGMSMGDTNIMMGGGSTQVMGGNVTVAAAPAAGGRH